MGVWGAGNFDSDAACDIRNELSDRLIQEVWTLLSDPGSAEADEDEHDLLFVKLEWLLALHDAGVFSGWNLPKPGDLAPVLEAWKAAWSTYFDGLSGPEFKAERAAVIDATFERFRSVCDAAEKARA